ncbi:ribonuclease HII [Pararhizobium mangrovi]|uniref:Ribonuclease HII n=1 Tax=Pararhizobium mangrovi TaxID=2590452 RepID=A0A506TV29_9HYPH|nr:ribonuclease HII [Pararhizobium mangrovi]TPW25922.1 ribonuclease HII [Pararhizobium mangrovi]
MASIRGNAAKVAPSGPDFTFEAQAYARGLAPVAGVDEVGRGPLAGPVVAAAVILDPAAIPDGLDDSKALTASERESLFLAITATAHVAIASSSSRRVDATDIRKASLDAMRRALAGLPLAAGHVLVDGRDVPDGLACSAEAIIGGDARSVSVAAASIVAKVTRDRMMHRADSLFPDYGFKRHVGYATAVHRAAIAELGPCPLHRMSFRTLRETTLTIVKIEEA